jgi:cystathionine beta-lyase
VTQSKYSKQTTSVHAGKRAESIGVVNAVEPSSAFRYIDDGVQFYPRYFNTPNQQNVVNQIRELEDAPAGMIFGSGMAAITTTLMALLRRGDHIVLQNALYGGTHSLVVKEFADAGIEYSFAPSNVESMMAAVKPNTRLIYAETPANPLLEIIDLEQLATQASKNAIMTVVDNTFASPINQNPLQSGIDIVLHSGTKYLGGHSDLSFGAVVSLQDIIDQVYEKAVHYGGNVNALTCYLIERSIKTLAIRVQQQNRNAGILADFLSKQPGIDQVFYPGLKTHPGHAIAAAQMSGFGGMVSFSLAEGISPTTFLQSLELIEPAMSLGAVESTVTIPALTSHKPMSAAQRKELGISDQLVRMSVGIESADDLVHDLENALRKNQTDNKRNKRDSAITAAES